MRKFKFPLFKQSIHDLHHADSPDAIDSILDRFGKKRVFHAGKAQYGTGAWNDSSLKELKLYAQEIVSDLKKVRMNTLFQYFNNKVLDPIRRLHKEEFQKKRYRLPGRISIGNHHNILLQWRLAAQN